MKAVVYDRYGGPEVLRLDEVPTPVAGPGEVLVRVIASSVTTADWRLRASAFPGLLWLPGRLMTGIFRPRNRVLGMEFAGEVAAVGAGVSRFAPGDAVFGFSGGGSNAEYLTIAETGSIAPLPEGLSPAEAAALPFGAVAALVFLRDFAGLTAGAHVLVNGASGGVGVYGVQIAKALGARVTAVASAENRDLLRALGADVALDYRTEDPLAVGRRYDVIFDTVGSLGFGAAREALQPDGLFLPLNFGGRALWQALVARLRGGPRIKLAVNGDSQADLEVLSQMVRAGSLRPVIDRRYPLERIGEAHAYVEARHRRGAVVIDVAGPSAAGAAA